MLRGIGCDIFKIERMKLILDDKAGRDAFLNHTYTKAELELIGSVPSPLFRYASHFAGKEAVFKALGISSNTRFYWREIEICYHETGQPWVVCHDTIKELCQALSIKEIHLSLSYDTDYAVAYAAAVF